MAVGLRNAIIFNMNWLETSTLQMHMRFIVIRKHTIVLRQASFSYILLLYVFRPAYTSSVIESRISDLKLLIQCFL